MIFPGSLEAFPGNSASYTKFKHGCDLNLDFLWEQTGCERLTYLLG